MKLRVTKYWAMLFSLVFFQSCIYFKGSELQPTASSPEYASSAYVDQSYLRCWQVIQAYLEEHNVKRLYESKGEGVVKVAFSKDLRVRFEISKVTRRRSFVKIDVWNNLGASKDLSEKYFNEIAKRLR